MVKKNQKNKYLIKKLKKSFGSHKIKTLNKNFSLKRNEYFQEYIDGRNTSVQFYFLMKVK